MATSPQSFQDLVTKRWVLLTTTAAILAIAWVPFVLIINPGWLTFLLFAPTGLLLMLPPVLVLLAIRRLKERLRRPFFKGLVISFFVTWFLTGFCFVNFGDTPESVRSLASRLFSGAASQDTLTTISATVSTILGCAAVVAAAILFIAALKKTPRP